MSIRENLGYTQKNYDPCFNYNRDNFACTDRSFKLMQNVLASQGTPIPSQSYESQFSNRDYEEYSIQERKVGLALPQSYTFNPQGNGWKVYNGRMPCTTEPNLLACQKQMPKYAQRQGCCNNN